MNKKIMRRLFGLASFVLVTMLIFVAPAWSSKSRAGDTSHRFGDKKAAYRGAIEKTGFYIGIDRERVSILDETSYKKLRYIVASHMIVTHQEQEIEWQSLLPHSIVKLIIVDAEVVEIVLLQESS